MSSTIKSSGNVNHHICQFINVIHFTLALTNQATLNTLPLKEPVQHCLNLYSVQ